MKENLAEEKMERVSAQAELDATKNKKPDTTEADNLRKELQALKTEHQASLMTAQQTAAKATEEHLATKSALEKAQAQLEKEKSERKSDFEDMHGSLTQVCEEATKRASDAEAEVEKISKKAATSELQLEGANKKVSDAQAQLEEATKKAAHAEELLAAASKKASDADARLKEAEAVIKVKEAELAEAKVCLVIQPTSHGKLIIHLQAKIPAPVPQKVTPRAGLAGSKFAEGLDPEPVAEEGEKDNSSAALASVRQPLS